MIKSQNYKPVSKRHARQRVKKTTAKPMDSSKSSIDRYREPILPEKTSYKFKQSDVFDVREPRKAKVKIR